MTETTNKTYLSEAVPPASDLVIRTRAEADAEQERNFAAGFECGYECGEMNERDKAEHQAHKDNMRRYETLFCETGLEKAI